MYIQPFVHTTPLYVQVYVQVYIQPVVYTRGCIYNFVYTTIQLVYTTCIFAQYIQVVCKMYIHLYLLSIYRLYIGCMYTCIYKKFVLPMREADKEEEKRARG